MGVKRLRQPRIMAPKSGFDKHPLPSRFLEMCVSTSHLGAPGHGKGGEEGGPHARQAVITEAARQIIRGGPLTLQESLGVRPQV